MVKIKAEQQCPCNINKLYRQCCEPYHLEQKIPATAELLMRSRYSAYARQKWDYIQQTWHSSTRPSADSFDDVTTKWIELIIKNTSTSKNNPDEAFVEFIAKYKTANGKAEKMQEVSRFVKEDGHWYYIDGVVS
ncbi:YchJ family protein [Zophobihabitans entericus]|uniref:UPF0225 protein IPMB12_09440 n=1 Tax=Zophobihabitans entericus TaxID=1635327 RepID=A0A6G9ICD5_9GAMM|nr:YchJ family protein [Zophobihabitans entericus]QIQ21883.1 YchJ family protein [Zophobihabitans entericus]